MNAREQFLGQLVGVIDPEEKRKIISREFIEVFQRETGRLPQVKWLAEGTIYPDVIESACEPAVAVREAPVFQRATR